MTAAPHKQWRIDNVDMHRVRGLRLQFRRYVRWSEEWDHDHCVGCWATFSEYDAPNYQHEGYATTDDYPKGAMYEWVCQTCFNDLKDDVGWSAVEAGPSAPPTNKPA